jgi:hypothetical protein
MRQFENVEKYLLNRQNRKLAKWIIIAAPILWIIFGVFSVVMSSQMGTSRIQELWQEWGLFLFHLPVSVALYMTIMSREEEEDEMYTRLRLEAMLHGVRFIFFGILAVGLVGSVASSVWNRELTLASVGGEMAVVTLLLVYANASYFFLKRQYHEE